MSSSFDAAVEKAAAILLTYRGHHGDDAFPTIEGKLWPIIEYEAGRNGIDAIYVKRFNEPMRPILGQVRRLKETSRVYGAKENSGVIYMCPTLDLDWQRFVQIKEACHLMLDSPDDYVTSDTDIDKILLCFAQFESSEVTKQYMSEMRALACAYELLFPFSIRLELKERYDAGAISPSDISSAARIPVPVVKHVMGSRYWSLAQEISNRIAEKQALNHQESRAAE